MSMSVVVALSSTRVVTAKSITEAGRRLGLEITLHDAFEFEKVGGFQPGTLDGREAGVEMELSASSDVEDMAAMFGAEGAKYDRIITFYWGASFVEGAFAAAVAAALIVDGDGVCYDGEGGDILTAARAAEMAREMLDAADQYGSG